MERRDPKNAALRNFIAWVEKTEMYGKFTVTVKKGVVVGVIEIEQTRRLEDFGTDLRG